MRQDGADNEHPASEERGQQAALFLVCRFAEHGAQATVSLLGSPVVHGLVAGGHPESVREAEPVLEVRMSSGPAGVAEIIPPGRSRLDRPAPALPSGGIREPPARGPGNSKPPLSPGVPLRSVLLVPV